MKKWGLLLMILGCSMTFDVVAQKTFPPKNEVTVESKPWPKHLRNRSKAKVKLPQNETAPFVYETQNYLFISDQKQNQVKMQNLATTAESVAAALGKVPLRLQSPPILTKGKKKHKIYIVADEKAYLKMGGTKSTAGYYSGRTRAVFLRADMLLNVEKPNYRLLIHELMHLNMHGVMQRCSAWFSEGNAEYVASAFYGTGSYQFTDMAKRIRERARPLLPHSEVLKLPRLAAIVYSDSNTWRKQLEKIAIEDRYRAYLAAVMLVHYFYHLDDNGRDKVANYLEALHQDITANKRVTDHQKFLFTANDLPKIEQRLVRYWKTRGFKIEFVESD